MTSSLPATSAPTSSGSSGNANASTLTSSAAPKQSYVPPHLRQGGRPQQPPSSSFSRGGGDRGGGGYSRGGGGGGRWSGNDRDRSFGGQSRDNGDYAQPIASARFAPPPESSGPASFSSFDVRGGAGGDAGPPPRSMGGGSSRFGSRSARKNELGFHGDMRTDPRIEKQLFSDQIATGINFDKYDDIPVETSGRACPDGIDSFDAADLPASLQRNLALCGFSKPTPVQKYAIPIGLADRDMMACAQTGSGKTGGFLFPVLTRLLRDGAAPLPDEAGHSRNRKSYPNALILAPTRELASQINDEAVKFAYATGIQAVVVYGGADIREQTSQLDRGCDLLVATPGRLVDLIERDRVSLACVRFLVLDEADRMLDMGFEPQIRRIVVEEDLPGYELRRTFMFSATFPREIQRLAMDFLHDYIFVTVGRVGQAAADITQKIEFCDGPKKTSFLMNFLSQVTEGLVLVFVETKRNANELEDRLLREGYPTTSIHGDRTQHEREEALRSFKSGQTPILVATDVAARGLDIANVSYVINYDMPNSIDDYVHRIGRTGRAGNKGTAISLINDRNKNIAKDLYDLLTENNQDAPPWLKTMASYGGSGGWSASNQRGGRGGGAPRSFASKDFRAERGDGGDSWGGGGAARAPVRGGSSYGGGGGARFGGGGGGGYGGGGGGGGGGDGW